MAKERMQYCFNCGAELGIYRPEPGDIECCGKRECMREMRDAYAQEREEAHEDLDRENGWGPFSGSF